VVANSQCKQKRTSIKQLQTSISTLPILEVVLVAIKKRNMLGQEVQMSKEFQKPKQVYQKDRLKYRLESQKARLGKALEYIRKIQEILGMKLFNPLKLFKVKNLLLEILGKVRKELKNKNKLNFIITWKMSENQCKSKMKKWKRILVRSKMYFRIPKSKNY